MSDRLRVVIVGGGFGGLEVAKRLRRCDVDVTIIDRHNYHLFQPLLYQVATGGLSPANIATPLRCILRKQSNCEVLLAEVVDIDIRSKQLRLADGLQGFDILVLAAGSTHSYFGNDEWAADAPGLKTIADATNIRRRIYLAFESAEREMDPDRRRRLLTFVVVGGGPTGVELAGALAEIADYTLKRDFRRINPPDTRIVLVEASSHLLNFYPVELCERAARKLEQLGVEVRVDTRVTQITKDHVRLDTTEGELVIDTETVLWGAGVKANPLGKKLAEACGVEADRGGRIPVTSDLSVAGNPDIFAIGDIAVCSGPNGKPLPGLAPVAIQQGQYVARLVARRIKSKPAESSFVYNDRGTMATIGRAAAVAQIGSWKFFGLFAWLMWLFIHLMLIVQFQNRLLILMQWAWNYATFNRMPG